MNGEPCRCGCGEIASYQAHYLRGHAIRGIKHSKEHKAKLSAALAEAHRRGAFKEGFAKRKRETLARRPLCKCGCGKPVKKYDGIYATRKCFPRFRHPAEHMKMMRGMRDSEKHRVNAPRNMLEGIKKLKESGEWEGIRQKCRCARGMPDHLAAKAWIIRDPIGNTYKFSNLREWARQNEWRFEDDRPESKTPSWLRFATGIALLFTAAGLSCSYRGWTAISKMELEDGGKDLLARNCELLNPKKEKHNG